MATVGEGRRPFRHMVMPWLAPPGSRLRVRASDRFLVSYPRSGNTWVRFMLTSLLTRTPATFQSIERAIPDIYRVPRVRLRRTPAPRILKSHEPFTVAYPTVVYLVRDPRDVAVSYFHYRVREGVVTPRPTPPDEWIESFVRGEADSAYGSWSAHVHGWLTQEQPALVLKYEELLEDPAHGLQKVATALGVDTTTEDIERAVADSRADRMRRLDRQDVASGQTTSTVRQGHDFIRRASEGAAAAELTSAARTAIETAFAAEMRQLNYL